MDDFFGRPFSNETSSAPAGEDQPANGSPEPRSPENPAGKPPTTRPSKDATEDQHATDLPPAAVALIAEARREEDERERERFKWGPEEESVIIMGQRAIAVYRNPSNCIVVREESPDGEDEDAFVVLRDDAAARILIAALKREVGERR